MDVFKDLPAKYFELPLLFPRQTRKIVKFSQTLGTDTNTSLTASSTLNHCDSMFIVFNKDVNERTCFINPELNEWQVNIDGKFYPREAYKTVDDIKFTNLSLDALNVNNNSLISISEDVSTSLQPYYNLNTSDANGTLTLTKKYIQKDKSNFFIGIPFSNDEDFMGGINSNSTAQIQLRLVRTAAPIPEDPVNPNHLTLAEMNFSQSPTCILLEDAILKIRSMKPPGRSQIEITNATVEQLAMGAL